MIRILAKTALAGLMISAFTAPAFAHHETDTLPLYPRDKADACDDNTMQIRVTVKGASHVGLAKVELYKPDDNWLKDETRKVRVPAEDGPFRVCINVNEVGTYAIAGYHDQDANRKLNKSFPFKPKEPFGVVNQDKLKKKKRPKFKQVSFEVGPGGVDVDLILIDPKDK